MDFEDFTASLQKIFNFYRSKQVEPYVQKLWFDQVKHIPSGPPLADIVARIMDYDGLPRNIPKAYRAEWDVWKRANADKMANLNSAKISACDNCQNTGLIFSRAIVNGMEYGFVSRCPSCQNWMNQVHAAALPANSKEDLVRNGHVIV